jgi:SAM-dependent methyltransferase
MPDGAFDRDSSEWQYQAYRTHWWYKARNRILEKVVASLQFKTTPEILEIGCGTGPNLEMLSKYGSTKGIEFSETSLEISHRTLPKIPVQKGWLPDNINVWKQDFDLVCIFDVLEHVEDDETSLQEIKKIIKNDGFLFLSVPAYQWLLGPYDLAGGHYRRYNKKSIENKLIRNGYTLRYSTYINTFLFPLVLAGRLIEKISSVQSISHQSLQTPNFILNKILYGIFLAESYYIPTLSSPFGSSFLALAQIKSN